MDDRAVAVAAIEKEKATENKPAAAIELPDGRIVLAYCTERRIEGEGENSRAYSIPEKTCFYYRAGLPE